jgi:tetratricopeptide (TPR) repeat protein
VSDEVEKLIQQAFQARRDRRFDDARCDLTQAVSLARGERAREEHDPSALATALTRLGAIERDTRHYDLALQHYNEAVSILRQTDDTLSLAHTIRHVGDIHCDADHHHLAQPYYEEALALYRRHGCVPPLDLGNAIRSFAVFKDRMGDREGARVLWTEALELYKVVGVDAGIDEATRRLSS